MLASDKELSAEQSRLVATTIREEPRGGGCRGSTSPIRPTQHLDAREGLGGRRRFTLATTIRLEEALGVSLRGKPAAPTPAAPANGDVAPDGLGAYSRRSVTWIEGTYVTVRPSFGENDSIFAYRTVITWDPAASCLTFRESERVDTAFTQFGEVAVPNQSGYVYLVTNRHGQHRLITVSRPTITGEMYGIISTLLAGRGSLLTPIAAPTRTIADRIR